MTAAKVLHLVSFGLWLLFLVLGGIGVALVLLALIPPDQVAAAKQVKGPPVAPTVSAALMARGMVAYFTLLWSTGIAAFAVGKMAYCLQECERRRHVVG